MRNADVGLGRLRRALDLPATATTAYTADKKDESRAPSRCRTTARVGAPLSFTDNGDGTITDNNTGLMWEKKSDDGGLHDKDRATLVRRRQQRHGLGLAGRRQRRRRPRGLQRLAPAEREGAPEPGQLREPLPDGRKGLQQQLRGRHHGVDRQLVGMAYWSSTTWARSTGMAWYVGFQGGTLSPSDKASGHHCAL